jgi:hypothetical protein
MIGTDGNAEFTLEKIVEVYDILDQFGLVQAVHLLEHFLGYRIQGCPNEHGCRISRNDAEKEKDNRDQDPQGDDHEKNSLQEKSSAHRRPTLPILRLDAGEGDAPPPSE